MAHVLLKFTMRGENGKDFKPGQEFCLEGSGGVGTFGGSEDHTAIMSCSKGKLNMFSYCPTAPEGVFEVDENVRFIGCFRGSFLFDEGAIRGSGMRRQCEAVVYIEYIELLTSLNNVIHHTLLYNTSKNTSKHQQPNNLVRCASSWPCRARRRKRRRVP